MADNTLMLSPDELRALTGYKPYKLQLEALHKAGFYRARPSKTGVILERAHYEAVCAGTHQPQRPKVTAPKERRHAPRLAPQGLR